MRKVEIPRQEAITLIKTMLPHLTNAELEELMNNNSGVLFNTNADFAIYGSGDE